MSIALDRLNAYQRRAIAESLLTDPRPFKNTELGSHCPFHSEKSPGGAFFYNFEDDLAYCHSCGTNSDLVGVFNAVNGRAEGDSDGCAEFVKKFCPDNGGVIPQKTKRPVVKGWQPVDVTMPPAAWIERAESFVQHSVKRLQENAEQLAILEKYGVSAENARLCRVGWNPEDKFPTAKAWGYPEAVGKNGKPARIWLPAGLVLPAISDGQVIKIKIRRPNPETSWGVDRRYWEVKGGANKFFHVYGQRSYRVWVIVETERDAAMVWFHGRHFGVGAIGTGGATKRPCKALADRLHNAKLILNSLDYDPAGAKSSYNFWEDEFPNCKRYPAPPSLGKDIGDAFQNGLDVSGWIWSGLPSFIRRYLNNRFNPELKKQSDPAPVKPADATHPVENEKPKTHWDQVLETLKFCPLWRQELIDFQSELAGTGFRVFRDSRDGHVYMGLENNEWNELQKDSKRKEHFVALRQRLHEKKILDANVDKSSLDILIDFYFEKNLEVR